MMIKCVIVVIVIIIWLLLLYIIKKIKRLLLMYAIVGKHSRQFARLSQSLALRSVYLSPTLFPSSSINLPYGSLPYSALTPRPSLLMAC